MGRVINPESAGKERTRLTRSIVLAIRSLTQQTEPNQLTRDLSAYIVLALTAIAESIESSVVPWEKRGYWVKADRFRLEWDWTARYAAEMQAALFNEDWAQVAMTAAHIAQKLNNVKVPQRHRLGEPWVGAWKQLQANQKNGSASLS
ncbi:MAG TPA: hypothetical protein VLS48_01905 [Anaerolineales bacterium]|nr:hypothetical protein [Anaerolineales bacterium]